MKKASTKKQSAVGVELSPMELTNMACCVQNECRCNIESARNILGSTDANRQQMYTEEVKELARQLTTVSLQALIQVSTAFLKVAI